jgi:hypothetical protein
MSKKVIFWVLAVVISLGTMVYQRLTGPTYEKDYKISYSGVDYKFELPRSHGRDSDCPVEIELPEQFEGTIIWRQYPTENPWETFQMIRKNGTLTTSLPQQPPAGKLEYHLELIADGTPIDLGESENVVVRFRDSVPAWAMIPHILLMVLTVIWSTATIFFALANLPAYKRYVGITIILLIAGGFIFGPIVQKYSFGQFWTGWPIGEDLTDNKVLFALIPFVVTWFLRKKSYSRWLAIASALIMLAVYLIPHSMNGSELDPETGEVITGGIILLWHKKSMF